MYVSLKKKFTYLKISQGLSEIFFLSILFFSELKKIKILFGFPYYSVPDIVKWLKNLCLLEEKYLCLKENKLREKKPSANCYIWKYNDVYIHFMLEKNIYKDCAGGDSCYSYFSGCEVVIVVALFTTHGQSS